MRENPYRRLPPIERKPDGSLYRMTSAQRKQANALIRRECCCYEAGNCMLLDDGDTHTCPQTISFSVCCKWFRWSVLPQIGTLEAEIFRDK
ncbi:cysteine-rich VLP domain-containing protein, partial [Massilicoli timonensis]|uniref:cysteine-rich VLP domain-containing protein n=1 Tax=Massilicoli timonensis TaxID=2015901 RepID=UPI003AAB2F16